MTRSARERRFIGTASLIALCLILFLLRGPLLRLVAVFARPLAAAGTWTTDRARAFCEAPDINTLREERDALAVDYAELELLRDENAELRSELGFVERRTERTVVSSIIARGPVEGEGLFVIDHGSVDGIRPGMPVITGDGLLVGKVKSTTETTASVLPTTDLQSATAGALLTSARTIGLVQGMAHGLMQLAYIPNTEPVQKNDLIVTSGLEEGMVAGLVIGIVNDVTTDETAAFQTAILEPLRDLRRTSIVTVLVTDPL